MSTIYIHCVAFILGHICSQNVIFYQHFIVLRLQEEKKKEKKKKKPKNYSDYFTTYFCWVAPAAGCMG